MQFVRCYYVQSTDDYSFLRMGDGDLGVTSSIFKAVAFYDEESAYQAVLDHFDGAGKIFSCWQPAKNDDDE